jgi:hypothetical protein
MVSGATFDASAAKAGVQISSTSDAALAVSRFIGFLSVWSNRTLKVERASYERASRNRASVDAG